jgi:hypothetical protein
MALGGALIILAFIGIGLGSLVVAIMTVVDASKYPDWAFQQTGSSKFVWQVIPIILIFVCGIAGGVMGLVWYTSKRDEVSRAARVGGPPPYYGTPPYPPPPGYGQQPPAPGWTPPAAPPSVPPSAPPPQAPPPEPPQ